MSKSKSKRSKSKLGLSGLVIGTAMAVPAAQAEPLTLTPDQMDTVTASGTGSATFTAFVEAIKNFSTTKTFTEVVDVAQDVRISGWFADANAVANCFGFGCKAETFTGADADIFLFSATAVSHSIAASDFRNLP